MAAQSSFNAAVAQLAKMAQVAGNDDNNEQLTQEELDRQKAMMANVDFRMVTFSLAGKDYAIDILKVKEIAKAGHFTYVPNTMPFVRGVHNLRGDIIPVIDLRMFFNVPVQPKPENALENMLIVTVGDQTFGVVVDVIDRVIGIQSSTIQPPHPLFGDINIKYIYGVVEADNRLFVLLDIDRIFGRRTAEEEAQYAQQTAQMQHYEAAQQAMQQAAMAGGEETQAQSEEPAAQEAQPQGDIDYTFIVDSLKTLKNASAHHDEQGHGHKQDVLDQTYPAGVISDISHSPQIYKKPSAFTEGFFAILERKIILVVPWHIVQGWGRGVVDRCCSRGCLRLPGGSDAPDLEVVVPAAVVFAALEVEGDFDAVSYLVLVQFGHFVLSPGGKAGLGREIAVRVFQDELLLGPGAAGAGAGLYAQFLTQGAFQFQCHVYSFSL